MMNALASAGASLFSQGVKHTLVQKSKSHLSVHLPLDELSFCHMHARPFHG
jgi:hypothetical protein